MFGWMDASSKHLDKYMQGWQKLVSPRPEHGQLFTLDFRAHLLLDCPVPNELNLTRSIGPNFFLSTMECDEART